MKLVKFLTHTKAPAFLTALMIGGISLTALRTIPNPPPPAGGLQNTDQFVFFADQNSSLEENATISSGDLGANGNLEIGKDTNITGNLFADTITLNKSASVNGDATFNKLKNEGEILGTKTTPVKLPIANLPAVQPFAIGTQDQTITGIATLPAGNYRDLLLKKNAKLTLSGGTYNLRKFELEENATLIFTAPTVINIQSKLKGQDNVSIFNGANAKHDDLHINIRNEQKNDGTIEQDNETESVSFGKNSFLNFTLLAPNASVKIEKDSILRGQILARKIKLGKNFIGSRDAIFNKSPDPTKLITDTDNTKYFVNEILVTLTDLATFSDVQAVANLVGGRIVGFMESANTYQIEILASTAQELTAKITIIRNSDNPLVDGVFRDYVLEII